MKKTIEMTFKITVDIECDSVVVKPEPPIEPPEPPIEPEQPVKRIIVDEQFEKSVQDMLKDAPYWVYLTTVHPTDYSDPQVSERIFRQDGGLRMIRKEGDRDVANPHLNGRTELRIVDPEPLNRHYMIHTSILLDDPTLQATFLQVMGKNSGNKTKPILSMDTKGTAVNVRSLHFDKEPIDGWFIREQVATYSDLVGQVNEFHVFYKPSQGTDGYIKVYLNKDKVFEKRGQTYYNSNEYGVMHQYGAYGTDGGTQQQTLRFEQYTWVELEEEGSL